MMMNAMKVLVASLIANAYAAPADSSNNNVKVQNWSLNSVAEHTQTNQQYYEQKSLYINANVKNIAFQKQVWVNWTTTDWQNSNVDQLTYWKPSDSGDEYWQGTVNVGKEFGYAFESNATGDFQYGAYPTIKFEIAYKVNNVVYTDNNNGVFYEKQLSYN
eukprot:Pgem_evm1s13044